MSVKIKAINTLSTIHFSLLYEADPSSEMINLYISRAFLFECLYNNKIVGIMTLDKKDDSTIEIMNISVDTNYQNKGIGTTFLSFADCFAKENHYSVLEVCTGSTSIWQLYFYQKHGFRIIDVQTDYFTHHYKNDLFEHGIQLKDQLRLQKRLQ
ncbi:GNAT family N-acetyltransferase [Vagococcus sp. JNUCC 83]